MKIIGMLVAVALLFLMLATGNQATEPLVVTLVPLKFGGGLAEITAIVPFEDGLLVAERVGRIYKLTPTTPNVDETVWEKELFLDLSSQVSVEGEHGFFSIAVSPCYSTTGNIYFSYINLGRDSVVAWYHVATQVLASAMLVEQLESPYHKGGQLVFGPDEMLYFALGDGDTWLHGTW